ncbi:GGDEF domain-containing protein [Microvirga lotononidis]|uniref:diguanylate cyclase n=1 Tax=Microvirga lotononidis TaxID=864069 RepID=I4YKF4_9HYPH|nr:GGDEF domain-containing protein [Microvirga lotononidis]EIM24446.1 diguanylate cyclase (GGDEF) domain-containing protein [Microvirga lotononidis]WQO31365.1 GGDEF domain-containing protein [Microvirga lotononidis]
MLPVRTFLTRLTRPTIASRRALVRYVVFVTVFGLAAALAIDVAQQLLFFTSWTGAFRSWAVTVVAVTEIATPVATMFARARWERQRAKDALEDLSRTDPLTGLPNRRALMEASEARTSQTMVLVIADIDRFKAVNDTYGHRAGDAVLQAVGRIMTQRLASYGLAGCLGGEEFALISSNVSLDQIIAALRDLLRAIETTPFITPGGAVRITMAAGVAIGISQSRSSDCTRRPTRHCTSPSVRAGAESSCRLGPGRLFQPIRKLITEHGIEALAPVLTRYGRLLPLKGEDVWLLNVTSVLDALERQKSRIVYFDDGDILDFEWHVFKKKVIGTAEISNCRGGPRPSMSPAASSTEFGVPAFVMSLLPPSG